MLLLSYHQPAINFREEPPQSEFAKSNVYVDRVEGIFSQTKLFYQRWIVESMRSRLRQYLKLELTTLCEEGMKGRENWREKGRLGFQLSTDLKKYSLFSQRLSKRGREWR